MPPRKGGCILRPFLDPCGHAACMIRKGNAWYAIRRCALGPEEDQAGTSETKPEQQRPSRNNLEPKWLRVEGPSSKLKVCLQVEAPTKNKHGNVSNNSGPSSDFAKLNCGVRPRRCVGRPANLKTLKVLPLVRLELVGSFICENFISGPNSQL